MNKLDFQVRVGRDIIKQMEQRIPEIPVRQPVPPYLHDGRNRVASSCSSVENTLDS